MASNKIQPCIDGKRHSWEWIKNKTYTIQNFHSVNISTKGIYKCKNCGVKKLGVMQHERD